MNFFSEFRQPNIQLTEHLARIGNSVSVADILENHALKKLSQMGLKNIVMCEGGKVLSPKAVNYLNEMKIPSVMVQEGLFGLYRAWPQQKRKIVAEFGQIANNFVVMTEAIARDEYGNMLDEFPNLMFKDNGAAIAAFLKG